MLDGVGDDVGDVLIDQRVHGPAAEPLDADQMRAPQHAQMLGDQWLAEAEPVHELVHVPRLGGQFRHDRQPGRGCQYLEQIPGGLEGLGLR